MPKIADEGGAGLHFSGTTQRIVGWFNGSMQQLSRTQFAMKTKAKIESALRRLWLTLHHKMSRRFADALKSQSFIQSVCRVHFQNQELHRNVQTVSLIEETRNQLRSNAEILECQRDFNRSEIYLGSWSPDRDISNRLTVIFDDLKQFRIEFLIE